MPISPSPAPSSFLGNISNFKQPGLVTHVNYLLNKLQKKKEKE